jgi:hypothetical protein
MLNREKVAQTLEILSNKLFPDNHKERFFLNKVWQKTAASKIFYKKIAPLPSSSMTPTWEGGLNNIFEINPNLKKYCALGIDGSQIYPDKHISGTGCFLINIGGCLLSYDEKKGTAQFFSEPKLLLQDQKIIPGKSISCTPDLVSLQREELELFTAIEVALKIKKLPFACLFDGGIIFWYLETKPKEIRDLFLKKYLSVFQQFYDNNIVMGSYISFPKSQELVNLIKVSLCQSQNKNFLPCFGKIDGCPCSIANGLVDRHIVEWFLPSNHRTAVFRSRSKITEEYPNPLKPHFFFLNTGKEIVRIETPAWIAKDNNYLNFLSKMCLNQCLKGYGYPVILAEAHEQAVIKGHDRDFFFHLIRKVSMDKNKPISHSQKSIKKRGLGV